MGRPKKIQVQSELIQPKENQIFQLKISLKHIKPPVWRRIIMPSKATFEELHEAIQEAFEWDDMHLHEFYFPRKGFWTPFRIRMRTEEEANPDMRNFFPTRRVIHSNMLDDDINATRWEDDICLRDVFSEDRKSLTYLYDFGDNWEHKVAVEKIYTGKLNSHIQDPICIKGKRRTPGEDSRGFFESFEEEEEERFQEILKDYNLSHIITTVKIHATGYIEILNHPAASEFNDDDPLDLLYESAQEEEEISACEDALQKVIQDLLHASGDLANQGDNIFIIIQDFKKFLKTKVKIQRYSQYGKELRDFSKIVDEDGLLVLKEEFQIDIPPLHNSFTKSKRKALKRFTMQYGVKALIFVLFAYLDPDSAEEFAQDEKYATRLIEVYEKFIRWLGSTNKISKEIQTILTTRLSSLKLEIEDFVQADDEGEMNNQIFPSLQEFQSLLSTYEDRFGLDEDEFDTSSDEFDFPTFDHLSKEELEEMKKLLEIATLLRNVRPWEHISSDTPIAVEDPVTGQIAYCLIMGQLGEHHGIACFLGDLGWEGMQFLNHDFSPSLASSDDQQFFNQLLKKSCLSASFEHAKDLEPMDRALYHVLNEKVPSPILSCKFRKYIPGYYPWKLNRYDIRFLTDILGQVLYLTDRISHDASYLRTFSLAHEKEYLLRKNPTGKPLALSQWKSQVHRINRPWIQQPYNLFDWMEIQTQETFIDWQQKLSTKLSATLSKINVTSFRKQHVWVVGDSCFYEFGQGDLDKVFLTNSFGPSCRISANVKDSSLPISSDTPFIQFAITLLSETDGKLLMSLSGSVLSLHYEFSAIFLDFIVEHEWYPEKIRCLNPNIVPYLANICQSFNIPIEVVNESKTYTEYQKFSSFLENSILEKKKAK